MQAEEQEGGICEGGSGEGKIWTGNMVIGFGAEKGVGVGIGAGIIGAKAGGGRGLGAGRVTRSLEGLQRGCVEVLRV